MTADKMPYNSVGAQAPETEADLEALAAREDQLLKEWSKRNLPDHKITFRWRYDNWNIQLYERRLHSLKNFNVGPAIQAWARSRLEWMRDEKIYEKPNGVLVFTIDPEGDIQMQLEDQKPAPNFTIDDLAWVGDELNGATFDGTVWVVRDGRAQAAPSPICHAADTLARDLLKAFGLEIAEASHCTPADLENAEVFLVNDEFGVVPCAGKGGPVTDKMTRAFDKLWSLDK